MVRWRIFCSLLAVSVLAVPVKVKAEFPPRKGQDLPAALPHP